VISFGGRGGHLPTDTEQRMADFTELIGTAIAIAESRAQLTARIAAVADDARRRIQRGPHESTQ
jgi:hypothetical protein